MLLLPLGDTLEWCESDFWIRGSNGVLEFFGQIAFKHLEVVVCSIHSVCQNDDQFAGQVGACMADGRFKWLEEIERHTRVAAHED